MLKFKLTTLDEAALVLIFLLVLIKAFGPKLWLEMTKQRGKSTVELKESSRGKKKKNGIRDVPGPWPSLPVLGTRWIYARPFGPYRLDKIHEAYEDMFKRYGPIVREESLWNYPVVSVMDRTPVEMVLRGSGGKYPLRPPTEATAYYRRSKPERYASVGLVNEQGPTWHHLRSTLTPELTSTRTIARFLPEINAVADDFIHLLKKSRDKNHLVTSFEEIANCIGLESTCTLILGRRMGFLETAKSDGAADKQETSDCSNCHPQPDANLNNIHIKKMYEVKNKTSGEDIKSISSDCHYNQSKYQCFPQGDQVYENGDISVNHKEKTSLGGKDDEMVFHQQTNQVNDSQREKQNDCKDRAVRLASAVRAHFQASRDTYYGLPFWKIIPTPAYRRMAQSEGEIYDIISDLVEQSQIDEEKQNKIYEDSKKDEDNFTEKGVQSVFMSVLKAHGLPLREKKAAIIDFIAAGIQTLGNTLVFLLYLISKNKEVQERLYNEVTGLMPNASSDELTHNNLKDAVYLKACIMEAFRVLPTAPLVARILDCEMNLNGYNLPAGTVVLCHTWMACMQESNFKNATVFSPERWLRDEGGGVVSPFLVAPFGCGKRMCPGKRFVEQELQVFLAKLVREFYIEFPEGLSLQFEFLLSPAGPVNVSFHDRTSCSKEYLKCQR